MLDHIRGGECGICFGRTLSSTLVRHGVKTNGSNLICPLALRNHMCVNCLAIGHTSSTCKVREQKTRLGYCNRCMLSIIRHRDTEYGRGCQLQTVDFTWTAAFSLYRHNRMVFEECARKIEQLPALMDDVGLCKWLMTSESKKPCALNVTRLVAAVMMRQNVTPKG